MAFSQHPAAGLPHVEVHGLVKRFGYHAALAGVDLTVRRGEAVALLGPNGAGKTTLLRVLALLCRPTSGTVRIAGQDAPAQANALRRQVGFLSHQTLLVQDLSCRQNLLFYARLYGLPDADARVSAVLGRLGLRDRQDDRVRSLSRGLQQRLAIARAFLHGPSLLLLDEPHAGLDGDAATVLDAWLGELRGQGCTLLMSSHDAERATLLCERLVYLERGRVVADRPRGARDGQPQTSRQGGPA